MTKKYILEESEDAGLHYEVLMESDDLEFLEQVGAHLDAEGLRWVIKNSQGRIIRYCHIHQSLIDLTKSYQGK